MCVGIIKHYFEYARIGIESGGLHDYSVNGGLWNKERKRILEARRDFIEETRKYFEPDFVFDFGPENDAFLLEQIKKGPVNEEEKSWRGKFILTLEVEFYPNGESVYSSGKERMR